MKPESKKNHEIKATNKFQHKKKNGSTSCYDLTKLAEALDLVEGKPNEAVVGTSNSVNKQGKSKSPYDFAELSEALSVAEKEEKDLDGMILMTQKRWLGIRMRELSLLQCINVMEKKRFLGLEHGKEQMSDPPIAVRLKRIVNIHRCRHRMLLH